MMTTLACHDVFDTPLMPPYAICRFSSSHIRALLDTDIISRDTIQLLFRIRYAIDMPPPTLSPDACCRQAYTFAASMPIFAYLRDTAPYFKRLIRRLFTSQPALLAQAQSARRSAKMPIHCRHAFSIVASAMLMMAAD